jgi:hypothetical protein
VIETGVKEFKIGIKNEPRKGQLFTMRKGQKLELLSVKIGWTYLGKRG